MRQFATGILATTLVFAIATCAGAQARVASFDNLRQCLEIGQTITVHLVDPLDGRLRTAEGELLDVSPSAIRLTVNGHTRSISANQILAVTKPAFSWRRAVIGASIGTLIGYSLDRRDTSPPGTWAFRYLGATFGFLGSQADRPLLLYAVPTPRLPILIRLPPFRIRRTFSF